MGDGLEPRVSENGHVRKITSVPNLKIDQFGCICTFCFILRHTCQKNDPKTHWTNEKLCDSMFYVVYSRRYVIIQGSAFMVDKMPKPLDISLHKEHHMLKTEAVRKNDTM